MSSPRTTTNLSVNIRRVPLPATMNPLVRHGTVTKPSKRRRVLNVNFYLEEYRSLISSTSSQPSAQPKFRSAYTVHRPVRSAEPINAPAFANQPSCMQQKRNIGRRLETTSYWQAGFTKQGARRFQESTSKRAWLTPRPHRDRRRAKSLLHRRPRWSRRIHLRRYHRRQPVPMPVLRRPAAPRWTQRPPLMGPVSPRWVQVTMGKWSS